MRFSKLRVSGFKSFVDPSELIISDGLTGVVGPNGCGKSNLLEALRWVMGENRPTSMRGEGMEDVIFSGAATRPARNFAEVALFLVNDERLASTEFNISDHVEIIRRVTRDIGSASKVNGKDVRARDVHMLFADASTGAHSPSLVKQGQIAEIINAKPKARRRILEEAAGISGLYQRRHEAELKLKGAETNLMRIDDIIEQLATQLNQLARQAKQATRYREIGEDLRRTESLLLYRRWYEAEEAFLKSQAELRVKINQAAQAEAIVQQVTKKRTECDAALPSLREEEAEASAALQRLILQKDVLFSQEEQAQKSILSLSARLEQLQHDIGREVELNRDAEAIVIRLKTEKQELADRFKDLQSQISVADEDAHETASVLQTKETLFAQITEDVARLSARHHSARRLLDDSCTMLDSSTKHETAARDGVKMAKQAFRKAKSDYEVAVMAERDAKKASENAEELLVSVEDERGSVQSREAESRAERSDAEGELGALQAEALALSKLVKKEMIEDNQVMDLVTVEFGYEKALGAALTDDLQSPIVNVEGSSGWVHLFELSINQGLPEGVQPLSNYVSVPEALEYRMTQIGLVDADDGQNLQPYLKPGQRLVSTEGDLWRWDGYRIWAEDMPSSSSLRLEQLNRLETLKQEMEHVGARADAAKLAHETLTKQLAKLSEEESHLRTARRTADETLIEVARSLSLIDAECNLAKSRLEASQLAVERHKEEASLARKNLLEAEKGLSQLDDLNEARLMVEQAQGEVETVRKELIEKRSVHYDLRREGQASLNRSKEIEREIIDWQDREATAERRANELIKRKTQIEDELEKSKAVPSQITVKRQKILYQISKMEIRKANAVDKLSKGEAERHNALQNERDAERSASNIREERASADARTEAARDMVTAATERITENRKLSPNQLLVQLDIVMDEIPIVEKLEIDVNRLRRQRDALGAVNLRAEEDSRAVQKEHETLSAEKEDLENAIRTLRSAIQKLNTEGRERLLTAFEQVNDNFASLFKRLFGGGEAKLEMVESEDPLEAGVEILCQPPGKKLAAISLLSGGEQTLTALAMLFAVFLANPSPICVLDEVDAPLDDANVERLCDLLDQMCQQTDTRFLIITHHAVTMSRMDRLYGVTMAEQGVSQLVSVDLKKAESLVV